jgi:hypothetical protein
MYNDTGRNRRNTIRGIAKGLKVAKAITNSLGTSPTETPEVDTKHESAFNPGTTEDVVTDKDGKVLLQKKKKPTSY